MADRDLDRILRLLVIFQCKWIKLSSQKVETHRMGKNKNRKKKKVLTLDTKKIINSCR